jgi:hypothetical protein
MYTAAPDAEPDTNPDPNTIADADREPDSYTCSELSR